MSRTMLTVIHTLVHVIFSKYEAPRTKAKRARKTRHVVENFSLLFSKSDTLVLNDPFVALNSTSC